MTFYALRVQCGSCGAAFLVGGDRGNDVAKWREYEVACPHCQATARPSNARAIDLASLAHHPESAAGVASSPGGPNPHAEV